MKKGLFLTVLAFALAACSSSDKEVYDDGGKQRIAVLTSTSELSADNALAGLRVVLPAPYVNGSWSQAGGNPSHNVGHLAINDTIREAWRVSLPQGNGTYERVIAGPVAKDGRVYAIDSNGTVSAFALDSGRQLWETALSDDARDRSNVRYGGGVAVQGDRVFATSGLGFAVALDAASGSELWRFQAAVPLRGAPTVVGGALFMLTHDNQMLSVDAETGDYLWDQVGISEAAGMLGAAPPATDGNAVVMALSSGELVALLAANGSVLWQDALSASNRLTPLATLADIDGGPVIKDGRVYAVSHAGSMAAVDIRTGERSWESDVAGVNTPWVAGRWGFVTTIDSQVSAISLDDGRARWVTQLQRFEKQDKRKGLIKWNGPVLAGDRLIVTSSHGFILSLSPYTGEVLSAEDLGGPTTLDMIVVDKTLIVQTDDGQLIAYR